MIRQIYWHHTILESKERIYKETNNGNFYFHIKSLGIMIRCDKEGKTSHKTRYKYRAKIRWDTVKDDYTPFSIEVP